MEEKDLVTRVVEKIDSYVFAKGANPRQTDVAEEIIALVREQIAKEIISGV